MTVSRKETKRPNKQSKSINDKKKVTSRPVKHEVVEVDLILHKIHSYCHEDMELYLAFENEHFAAIVKVKKVMLSNTINAPGFQPYEQKKEALFFHLFLLEWGDLNSKYDTFGKLIDMKVPVFKIRGPDGVGFAIREA